jgi:hypothetical protein
MERGELVEVEAKGREGRSLDAPTLSLEQARGWKGVCFGLACSGGLGGLVGHAFLPLLDSEDLGWAGVAGGAGGRAIVLVHLAGRAAQLAMTCHAGEGGMAANQGHGKREGEREEVVGEGLEGDAHHLSPLTMAEHQGEMGTGTPDPSIQGHECRAKKSSLVRMEVRVMGLGAGRHGQRARRVARPDCGGTEALIQRHLEILLLPTVLSCTGRQGK